MDAGSDLLEVSRLHKRYSAPVLDDFSFNLRRGEVHAVVGSNGAGKSTFVRILAGLTRADSGQMRLEGRPYNPVSKRDAERAGVTIVLQELNVIGTLSLAENIFLNRLPERVGFVRRGVLRDRARDALARVGLGAIDPDLPAAVLGVGQQQLVEIAGALSQHCPLLILDEPTAALTDPEIAQLFDNIRRLKSEGVGIVYVSHRMEEIHRIADRITVLRDGRRVATHQAGEPSAALLVQEMVGHELPDRRGAAARPPGQVALTVRRLRVQGGTDDVSFEVRHGEIVGIAGLIGSGRTELLRAIFGADPRAAGEILIDGEPTNIGAPWDAVRAGLALIPEDRKRDGLLMPLSVGVNAMLSAIQCGTGGWLDKSVESRNADAACARVAVRCASTAQPVAELSGGNQQKVMIARWLARGSQILLCDEPTRGIDVAAKDTIHALLRDLAAEGKAVLVVSSDLLELMAVCDRIMVMAHGRVTAQFTPADWTQEAITQAAFGV
jgi:ribose transport system ATP-binding protein